MPSFRESHKYTTFLKKEGLIMPKSRVWPAAPLSTSFNLHLFIQEIKNLPLDKLEDCSSSSYIVQVEWRGSTRTSLIPKGFTRNCTTKQQIQRSGAVSWNEGFDHICKLRRLNAENYRSWIVNLEIQEIDHNYRAKLTRIGRAKMDVAEFALQETGESTRVPINCNIKGHAAEAELMIKLQFAKLQTSSSTAFTLPRSLSLRSFSCARPPQTYSNRFKHSRTDTSDSSSDGESDLHYGKLSVTNFFLVGQFPGKLEENQQTREIHIQQPVEQQPKQQQPSLVRLLSRNKSKTGVTNSRGPPLLNKEREDGGDDIDNDRRQQMKVLPEESLQPLGFEDENRFEVGKWEEKKIVSRDGEMELTAKVFFASIDQRSDKAAGGGACSVLATTIAHWLHDNPKTLPLRCQLDELVHEGSSEWRRLCENENHRQKFSDQHFDLETVLEARVRPLEVMTGKSYIGFFSLGAAVTSSEFLQGAMSFDSMWSEIVSRGEGAEERVYIASWNDHFFVMKVERDVIHLIDTLGERLLEGCNQAYILKFGKESAVHRRGAPTDSEKIKGKDCCKEYIKGFLAAVPLRELQHDIERGVVEETLLHRRLQIEFHHTTPCNVRS